MLKEDYEYIKGEDRVMRQYTTPEQTTKLIELGFEKPCSIASVEPIYGMGGISVAKAYSIGELIEMLPVFSCIHDDITSIQTMKRRWYVAHVTATSNVNADELVDALYFMIIKLKEEGVI